MKNDILRYVRFYLKVIFWISNVVHSKALRVTTIPDKYISNVMNETPVANNPTAVNKEVCFVIVVFLTLNP
jgi:hypothetical protein